MASEQVGRRDNLAIVFVLDMSRSVEQWGFVEDLQHHLLNIYFAPPDLYSEIHGDHFWQTTKPHSSHIRSLMARAVEALR